MGRSKYFYYICKKTMKIKSTYTTIIAFIFFIGLMLSIKSNLQLRHALKNSVLKQTENEIKLNSVLWATSQHYKYIDKKVTDLDVIINKQTKNISSILSDKYEVFYKFSLRDCSNCIISELKNIKEKAKYIKILIETPNIRDFKTFIDIHHIDTSQAFQIKENILEDAEQPFYFVTNKESILRDIFFPIKEMPQFTLTYFQAMRNKYSNNCSTF